MATSIPIEEVLAAFPFLREAPPEVRRALAREGRAVRLEPGRFICMEGDRCPGLALITAGTARVYKTGESGREITLYRIEPGESCILTATCILGEEPFPAFAVTETPVEAVLIPASVFRRWVEQVAGWREYVFRLMARRLGDVIAVVEEVTFRRLDARLATYLLQALPPEGEAVLHRTHEAIATDLGSAREVVSRLLKDFEHAGAVRLARGAVYVLDVDALREVARRDGRG
ncbi:MAG: Crp/Fnr family transcriptional regulator [Bacteroidetes bacterium]|nr:MAG: Crp/Fnr family transcriptional regulator [Bacteroidota bacterium]